MASLNKVIIIGKFLPVVRAVHDIEANVKPDAYCGFKNDIQRRKALGTRDRWRALSVIAASAAFALVNGGSHLQGLLTWLKHLGA